MVQLGKRQTLDLVSGHDLTVCGFEPQAGLQADSVKPAWDSLSALTPHACALSLSLSLSK